MSPPFAAFSAASNPAVVDTLKTVPVAGEVEFPPAPVGTLAVVPAVDSRSENAASNTAVVDAVEIVPAAVAVGTIEAFPAAESRLESAASNTVVVDAAEVAPAVESRLEVVKVILRYPGFTIDGKTLKFEPLRVLILKIRFTFPLL